MRTRKRLTDAVHIAMGPRAQRFAHREFIPHRDYLFSADHLARALEISGDVIERVRALTFIAAAPDGSSIASNVASMAPKRVAPRRGTRDGRRFPDCEKAGR
jgi:hypothetical protein